MIGKILYPLFASGVLFVYAVGAFAGKDVSAVDTQRSRIPSQYLGGAYQNAPVVWRSGFHGPGPAPVVSSSSSSSSSSSRSGGYGGYYGGFGGGK